MTDRTALAEAELEYHDETTPSIYVNFPMVSACRRRGSGRRMERRPLARDDLDDDALDPPGQRRDRRASRARLRGRPLRRPSVGQTVQTILAAELVAKVMGLRKVTEFAEVGRCRGKELEHAEYRHPFIDRVSPIVLADYVSVEDGTGLVHTAPGHGAEDYQTGRTYQLPTLSPVDRVGPVHGRGARVARRQAGVRGQSRRSSAT